MFNKVIITFSTRVLTAILSLINVLIGTNFLGVEGFGTISLIILGITIYLMIQNLVAGSPVMYFSSRIPSSSILIFSYLWLVVSILIFTLIVFGADSVSTTLNLHFELVPEQAGIHAILLALCYGLMNIHLNMILGWEKIRSYNLIFFVQHGILTASLLLFFLLLKLQSIWYYILSMYISYLTAFLLGIFLSVRYIGPVKPLKISDFSSMFRYGLLGQTANVFQLLNYRLSYYLVDFFAGRASLGIFAAATQVCEGLWIFGKSIATVQFVRISRSENRDQSLRTSLRIMKFTAVVTLIPLIIIIFLPLAFYQALLGKSFSAVPEVIWWLALGTLSLSASVILSTYFSGTGRIGINTLGSGIGLIATLIFGFALIPYMGLKGAALATSLSYLTSFVFLLIMINRENKLNISDFVLKFNDLKESWVNLLSSLRAKK